LLSVFVKIVGKFFDDVGPLPTDVEAKTWIDLGSSTERFVAFWPLLAFRNDKTTINLGVPSRRSAYFCSLDRRRMSFSVWGCHSRNVRMIFFFSYTRCSDNSLPLNFQVKRRTK
jgi:hypothetical protein